jgi:4-amino-4-deoxy-L-arabinose transferase-like glycosyltransferase
MEARAPSPRLAPLQAAFWIVCLAALAVGARNFETGIAVDANTYGLLARGIARTGEWFYLPGSTAELTPFAEHPHLGIWLVALVFKILPAADWSGRIVGHVFYIAFLLVFFLHLRREQNQKTAVGAVLLLWIWARFSNFFSNIYLDPGCLFFGFSAIPLVGLAFRRRQPAWAALAGLSLALSAMTKGMTVLGFLPAVAFVCLSERNPSVKRLSREAWELRIRSIAALLVGLVGVLALYDLAIQRSNAPDFLEVYFRRQWAGRFSQLWDWWGLFRAPFWTSLWRDSYYTLPLALLAWPKRNAPTCAWVPWILLLTFICMYAPAGRYSVNYWVTVLPWVAWLVSTGALARLPWNPTSAVKASGRLAIAAVVLIQYIPVRTHGSPLAGELVEIERLKKDGRVARVWVDFHPHPVDFTYKDSYAWNTDLPTDHVEREQPVPSASANSVLVPIHPSAGRDAQLRKAGWCPLGQYGWRFLWASCPP